MRTLEIAILCGMVGYGLVANAAGEEALQVQRQGAIAYVSGGVSFEERERLASMSDNFNLKVTLAIQEGNYLSDVQLRIHDQRGNTLVDTLTNGPWFYADLQPGTYTVEVSHSDQSLTKIARVSHAKQTQLIFTW